MRRLIRVIDGRVAEDLGIAFLEHFGEVALDFEGVFFAGNDGIDKGRQQLAGRDAVDVDLAEPAVDHLKGIGADGTLLMGKAGVIYRDVALMKHVFMAADPKFASAFLDINNLAEIVNLRRGIKAAVIDHLSGVKQLGHFLKRKRSLLL